MLQKSYSEGIFLEHAGPQTTSSYKSTYNVDKERSYRTAIYFVPKLIPKRTYLSINGTSEQAEAIAAKALATYNRSCSLSNGKVQSYESSMSIDQENTKEQTNGIDIVDGAKCFQNIELVPGLAMKDFSESINVFPKTNTKSYSSNIEIDDPYVKRNYIVGLEVQKFRQVELTTSEETDNFRSSMHISPCNLVNNDVRVNGDIDDLL